MNQYLGVPLDVMSIIPHGVDHNLFVAPNNKKEVQGICLEGFSGLKKIIILFM